MKILVLNCGSSSIKYALYDMDTKKVLAQGGAERVGLDGAFVKVKLADGSKRQIMHDWTLPFGRFFLSFMVLGYIFNEHWRMCLL